MGITGGCQELEERFEDTVIREAKEELGISLKRENLKIVHIMHHYTGKRMNFILETEKSDWKPRIMEVDKCEELKWVEINNLPENTMEKVKIIISYIEKGELYSRM